MSLISVSLAADGTTADVADVNTPITTIVNAINGSLDSTNISSLSGTKLTAATVPGSAFDATTAGGYIAGLTAPSTVTALGNRSYSMVFNSLNYSTVLSAGMRLRTTRTVAAPTQCTSLNGSTQYYSKVTPAGMTFTDDFVVSAWIKASSYASESVIVSRYNGTSGWELKLANGAVQLVGYNAGAGNYSYVASYQAVPLNKWVHVTAQLDMSTFTATPTTSYVMIDGIDVPASVTRAGTSPTALVQAGNLEIGSRNTGAVPFPGKIAQVAIYNAKVTQATILASIHQTLSGTETSLISAYSFNNTISDLNTTSANNLTANGSAVATSADSPFGGQADGTISSTLDYAIIQLVSFSTNTTVTLQVAEGCTIPTSGSVSAVVYSSSKSPYGFPVELEKWQIRTTKRTSESLATGTTSTFTTSNHQLKLPIGKWNVIKSGLVSQNNTVAGTIQFSTRINGASYGPIYDSYDYAFISGTNNSAYIYQVYTKSYVSLTVADVLTHQMLAAAGGGTTTCLLRGDLGDTNIIAENAYL